MRIIVTSVFVDNQAKALQFYTEKLGFIKKHDEPVGAARWLTVVSPHDVDGAELLLEPNDHPAAKTYQAQIYADGIPATMFGVTDVAAEYERLQSVDVQFAMPPTKMGDVIVAVFDDTCGNLIQIVQT